MHLTARRLLATTTLVLAAGAGAQVPGPAVIASATSSAPSGAQAIAAPAVAAALRQGGYVVYLRHSATDFSRGDGAMKHYQDCDNQRLLSAQGRSDARAAGEQIRRLRLPVGEVLASPYCRTMETARLMFSKAQPRNEIRERTAEDYPGLKQLLATPVPAGSNRWIVGHGTPFRAIAGAPHLAEGEAAVLKPRGNGWNVVARVKTDEWAALEPAGER